MHGLNYHHLLYFWVVAREGGLVPAASMLRLSHPTLSTQIRSLESSIGQKLFTKRGRRLTLTEAGEVAFRYAQEIFGLGKEMLDTLHGASSGQALRLRVGVVDVVPKLAVRRMLQPALSLEEPVRLVCHEDSQEKLLADLALHSLHLVLTDAPVPAGSSVRAFNHLLGESGVSFFATADLAKSHRRGFPRSLNGAPLLLPLEDLTLRRSLNQWFNQHDLHPHVVAEFEDSALFKVFGADGIGIFPAPTAIEREVTRQYGVKLVGRADSVKERFYAITMERKITHPAVIAICESARHDLFA